MYRAEDVGRVPLGNGRDVCKEACAERQSHETLVAHLNAFERPDEYRDKPDRQNQDQDLAILVHVAPPNYCAPSANEALHTPLK
jgi:hypothetical protein